MLFEKFISLLIGLIIGNVFYNYNNKYSNTIIIVFEYLLL